MNLIEQIEQNQKQQIAITIGIDNMQIKNDIKQRVLNAMISLEDFALKSDEGSYAYFIGEGFMIYKSHDNKSNSVTRLADKNAWQNSLKVVLLGHRTFISQRALLLNADYVYIKDGLKKEQLLIR